jgi:outer membrane protein assembly factor BamB
MRATHACLLLGLTLVACRHAPPLTPPPLFPMAPAWTTPLSASVDALAVDAVGLYVATRDGVVRGLDPETGTVRWEVAERPGVIAAGEGLLAVRQEDGIVYGMNPRTGNSRWKADAGVRGTLPPVLYKDAVLVAGAGLAVLDAATGQTRWTAPEVRATTAPVAWGPWLLVGEADGTVRGRDLVTGAVQWSFATARPLLAPPVVDEQGRVFLGTTDRRFLSLEPGKKGKARWSWRIGADVPAPPVVAGPRVLFTTHEDVLYALRRSNGHLAWRAALPSRPLSGPLPYGDAVLVACFGARPGETFLIGFDARTGRREGDLKAPGEIRSPPVIVRDLVVLGLRERAVSALRLGSVGPNP